LSIARAIVANMSAIFLWQIRLLRDVRLHKRGLWTSGEKLDPDWISCRDIDRLNITEDPRIMKIALVFVWDTTTLGAYQSLMQLALSQDPQPVLVILVQKALGVDMPE
jgi:hypothetical protein